MHKIHTSVLVLMMAVLAPLAHAVDKSAVVVLDEQVWVLFYDLPSRRFRAIRDSFVSRRFDDARRDLLVSAGFLRAEIQRADPVLVPPMTEVVERIEAIANNIESPDVTLRDLDPVFARAHWLLSQHYLLLATMSRDSGQHANAGNYLWATAHHMERTVLWANARISTKLQKSLEELREMADGLRSSDHPERIYRKKPVDNARRILVELGQFLDRKVWIEPVKR